MIYDINTSRIPHCITIYNTSWNTRFEILNLISYELCDWLFLFHICGRRWKTKTCLGIYSRTGQYTEIAGYLAIMAKDAKTEVDLKNAHDLNTERNKSYIFWALAVRNRNTWLVGSNNDYIILTFCILLITLKSGLILMYKIVFARSID